MGLCASAAAIGEDEIDSEVPPGPTVGLMEGTPPRIAVVGFVDADDEHDCDPVLSRYGRCVEKVRFLEVDQAQAPSILGDHERNARMTNTGRLYAQMWENLAYRWKSDDMIESTLVAGGVTRLPTPPAHWEISPRGNGSIFSMPHPVAWFDHLGFDGDAKEGQYDLLRYHYPNGLATPPDSVIMVGRFARRLAYDGKLHTYDVMDGDPESSGPFFEQMFPYDTALSAEHPEMEEGVETSAPTVPLAQFVSDERLKSEDDTDLAELLLVRREAYKDTILPANGKVALMRDMTSQEFEDFYRNVGIQIIRFAREEYTPTHLRVLTALMAMESPPSVAGGGANAKDVVAASAGQTDPEDLLLAEIGTQEFGARQTFDLNYGEIPRDIIAKHIKTFAHWKTSEEGFLIEYEERIFEVLGDMLRPEAKRLQHLDEEGLKKWAEESAYPGRALFLQRYLKRIGLRLLAERLTEQEKDELETNILLDHVNAQIVSTFDPTPRARATPAEMEDAASGNWAATLNSHGFFSNPLPDGPGAVNPLAICTTHDRLDALGEPSFGAVDVDMLVMADAAHTKIDELLWSVRDQVPFLMIDDPKRNPPKVTRLVLLPDDKALYRIRWNVWTGWHLMWGAEPIDEEGDEVRIALRSGAICSDMVLAPPDLVPTILRAALLEGDLRPSSVVRGNGRQAMKRFENMSEDEYMLRLEDGLVAADQADKVYKTVGVGDSLAAGIAIIGAKQLAGAMRPKPKFRIPVIQPTVVNYLREVALRPLRVEARGDPLLTVVFDHSVPRKRQSTWAYRTRTPYARAHHRAGKLGHVRTASWGYFVPDDRSEEQMTLLSPGYLPTESVNTDTLVPRWRRRSTGHFTLSTGLSMFPVRRTKFACPPESDTTLAEPSTVVVCAPGIESTAKTEGFAWDFAGLRSIWVLDKPRMGVEFGPELRLETLHPGESWFHDGNINYGFTLRFQFGILVGLRFAPAAGPLQVRARGAYPWGAPQPDGGTRLGRFQYGVRFGALMGPGFNGLEGSVASELWMGWSLRSSGGKSVTFTPYYPTMVLGPFVRGQATKVIMPAETERYYDLKGSLSIFAGIRLQMRVDGKAPEPPEAPQ
jgi:hypothetical protein